MRYCNLHTRFTLQCLVCSHVHWETHIAKED